VSYKLGIVGSRVWTSKAGQVWNKKIKDPKQYVFDKMDQYVSKHGKPSLVISGGAKGADTYGIQWAQSRGIPIKEYKPDQRLINTTNFRHAAMTRNTDIVNNSDRVVAFWDKKSTGTFDTLTKAKKAKKKVSYFNVGD
tara:strand:- start:34 stop:447 length:414 start_codon:yes stop_codon:yes gene_type:complete